jgi:hypothetical protein
MIEKRIVWDYPRVGEHCELELFELGRVVDHRFVGRKN